MPALGGGVRLGSQQRRVQLRRLPSATRWPAQLGAVRSFALAEQELIRSALHYLAKLQPQRPGACAPPAARRLSPGLAGLEVVPGRVLGRAAVHLLPDVLQVIPLAEGRHDRHPSTSVRGRGGIAHAHRMVHGCEARNGHASRVREQPIKIRNC
jgi:hypothetical protein